MNIPVRKEKTIARRDRKLCPTIDCGEGLTEQAHKSTCDINKILADYARTGFMRHAKEHEGKYDDVSAVDFQEAQFIVANVKNMFEGLPSEIRKEFDHDPAKFLDYAQDPKNGEELAKRGILAGNDGLDIAGAYNAAVTREKLEAERLQKQAGEKASEGTSETASQQTSESASG